jgi:hypothetical protein
MAPIDIPLFYRLPLSATLVVFVLILITALKWMTSIAR